MRKTHRISLGSGEWYADGEAWRLQQAWKSAYPYAAQRSPNPGFLM